MDIAIKLAKGNKTYKIVTLKGDIINPSGAISGGSVYKKQDSILGRGKEIESLKKDIKTLIINFMYLLFIDIYLFMNGRKEIRKVLPIITYELAIIIYGVLRFFVISPAYTIYSLVSSVVVIVMINTIQNY